MDAITINDETFSEIEFLEGWADSHDSKSKFDNPYHFVGQPEKNVSWHGGWSYAEYEQSRDK